MAETQPGTYPFVPDPAKVARPSPNLATVYRVERIMIQANKRAEDPLSLDEIKRRMGSKGVRHVTVKACVGELERQGKVTRTKQGVLWTWMSPRLRERMSKEGFEPLG